MKKALLLFVFLNPAHLCFAQELGGAKPVNHFSGAISVTTKGISTVPTFTLGKPAAIFDMSMGRRLRFEPQFRFALEGKPWTFLFWWRYKLISNGKLAITLGTHPALAFRARFSATNGVAREIMVAQRYLAGELTPTFMLAKNVSLGMYYLYSYGVEKDVTKNTHYLAVRGGLSNLKLAKQFVVGFTPQLYYLKLDKQDGFYYSSTLTLAKRNFPLSLSSILTKAIRTDILSQNLLWNVTLIYSFTKSMLHYNVPAFFQPIHPLIAQGDSFMKRNVSRLALVLFSATAFSGFSQSFDWPQWQGPDRNAVSKEKSLLKEWPQAGPTLAWKIAGLGGGDGTPSIAAGKIFGMSNRGSDEVVWALSESDGKTIWTTRLGPAFNQSWPQSKDGPGSTPTVDGERLYVLGLGGNLACVQVRDGKIVWQRSLQQDFGGSVPTWSFRESPLVDGDKVICTPGGEDATLVALDKLTGKTIWKSQVPDSPGAAYSSAIAIDFEGQRQYVQLTAKALVGVAASDGKFLWRYDKPANPHGINCSTPIYHNGFVFAASAYDNGGGLVKLSKEANGGVKAEEVYFSNKMQNHHGGMILFEGNLYGANGGNAGGALVCLDFQTGNVMWDERRGEKRAPKGSVAFADGRLYYRTEDGAMLLIEPSAKEYIERGRFVQPDRSKQPAWAHPVIANGKLYLRDQDVLFCYDVKAKGK